MEKFVKTFINEIGTLVLGDCREVKHQYSGKEAEIELVIFRPNPKEDIMFYLGQRSKESKFGSFVEVQLSDFKEGELNLLIEQLEYLAARSIGSKR